MCIKTLRLVVLIVRIYFILNIKTSFIFVNFILIIAKIIVLLCRFALGFSSLILNFLSLGKCMKLCMGKFMFFTSHGFNSIVGELSY